MADEKTRTSGEVPQSESKSPLLPTVNPDVEKPQPSKPSGPGIHPAVYVALVAANHGHGVDDGRNVLTVTAAAEHGSA